MPNISVAETKFKRLVPQARMARDSSPGQQTVFVIYAGERIFATGCTRLQAFLRAYLRMRRAAEQQKSIAEVEANA